MLEKSQFAKLSPPKLSRYTVLNNFTKLEKSQDRRYSRLANYTNSIQSVTISIHTKTSKHI